MAKKFLSAKKNGKGYFAVIVPYEKYKAPKKERPLGILKGKASFKIKDDFKMTDEEFLNS